MTSDSPADVAKRETARQSVILIFGLVGTAGTLFLMRTASDPDAWNTTKMHTALLVKRYAEKRVTWWQGIADKAATQYNRAKP